MFCLRHRACTVALAHHRRYGIEIDDDTRSDKELSIELGVNIFFLFLYLIPGYLILTADFTGVREGDDALTEIDLSYWAFVTLTTIGYGDVTPIVSERIFVAIWLIYGMAVMSSLLGVAAEFFLKKQQIKMDIIRKQASIRGFHHSLAGSGARGTGRGGWRVPERSFESGSLPGSRTAGQ